MCVILDEAYCEFNLLDDPDASLELLDAHPNLVLLRTFSKVHGLCGLRVGFALCGSEELPRALDQVRQPFFCNALAQAAAIEALAHQDASRSASPARSPSGSPSTSACARSASTPADSQANFCWFALGEERDEQEVMRGLQERGVLVRGGSALGSDVPALRVTYGLPEENARFLDALAEVLAPAARPLSCLSLLDGAPPVCYKLTQAVMTALAPTSPLQLPPSPRGRPRCAYLAWRFI